MHRNSLSRRMFLNLSGATAGMTALPGVVRANRHPHPNPGSLGHLDRQMYIRNMTLLAHFHPPGSEIRGFHRTAQKAQMMVKGSRRFLFQAGRVYDVSDPLRPEIVNEQRAIGGQIQLAYNREIDKWILVTGAGTPPVSATRDDYHGKYDSPEKVERVRNFRGLRGVRIFDATDPMNISLLSEWACDQGDPSRAVQTGGGTHRNYYSGGRYAYLDSAPDDSFVHLENEFRLHSNCIQTVDLSDPAKPKFVSNWWLPGQRASEQQAYQRWRYAGDRTSWTGFHGPMYVPVKVEDGGRYGYSSYGHFGVFIHDVSDPAKPLLVGKFDPVPQPGGIAFHTVDVTRLDRGIILASPETLNPDCNEPWQDTYVLDVSDVTQPSAVSRLPIPAPPEEAPYTTFCNKRGRFGTHNPMHAKAPGKAHPDLTFYACFNAGVQMFDISRPDRVVNGGWFIPPQAGELDDFGSFNRDADNVFVEWDRRLIWALTSTGLYLLSTPALGEPIVEPMAVQEWALPGLNAGHG